MCLPTFTRSIVQALPNGSSDVDDDDDVPDLVHNDGNIVNLAFDVITDNVGATRPAAVTAADDLPSPFLQQTLRWGAGDVRLYIDDSVSALPALRAATPDFIYMSDASLTSFGFWPINISEGASAHADVISRFGSEEGRDIRQYDNLLFSGEGRNMWGEVQHWFVARSSFTRLFSQSFDDSQTARHDIAVVFSHVARFIPIEQPYPDDVIIPSRGTQNIATGFYPGEDLEEVD